MTGAGDHARDPSSLFEILRDLEAEGYTGEVVTQEGGDLLCRACDTASPAGEFAASGLRRLEGASDPADMSAVTGVTCPRCGARAVLVVRYGPDADGADADVLVALDAP